MTKLQLSYHLTRPLDESLMQNISRVYGVYGIHHIRVDPSLTDITVEYDASRLAESEVADVLARAGIPAERR